ncbi:hypothetical protein PoMZ_08977 [Pyricularia oryzae]|uniref:Uncharacterized protein n=1 Tax=Pyricularia oryzae TaxID=318829 RepID=A0A4P7MVN1_PYROR|nr:hypothetical protein PoMZ_08977 [Pyricularia oryzae]
MSNTKAAMFYLVNHIFLTPYHPRETIGKQHMI